MVKYDSWALRRPVTSKRLEIRPSFMYSLCLPLSTISVFVHTLIMSKQRICIQKESKALKVKRALRFIESMHCGLASWPAVGQPDTKRTPQGRKDGQTGRTFQSFLSRLFPLHACRSHSVSQVVCSELEWWWQIFKGISYRRQCLN